MESSVKTEDERELTLIEKELIFVIQRNRNKEFLRRMLNCALAYEKVIK